MIPGMPAYAPSETTITFATSVFNTDVFAFMGSPTYPVNLTLFIPPSVILGSLSAANGALDVSSFNSNSRIMIIVKGRIQGAGGTGGDGAYYFGNDIFGVGWRQWGGGGGGAGTNPGIGGYHGTSSPGGRADPGTVTTGGAGAEFVHQLPANPAGAPNGGTAGEAGGDAIVCGDVPTVIDNFEGEIWGGGGGGGGTFQANAYTGGANQVVWTQGGAGGAPGQPGSDGVRDSFGGLAGGAAGFAVRGTAFSFRTAVGQASPNLEGGTGP